MLSQELINNPPFVQAAGYRTGRIKPVELIVIHTMEAPDKGDTAEATAHYFQNEGLKASAHYCIDDNSIVQCVYDHDTAWHCVNANANGIGLEHAGYAKQNADDWMSDYNKDMLDNSAQLAAYLCKKFGIPVQKAVFAGENDPSVVEKGFCGHAEVPLHGAHWDPGTSFPWDYYLGLVNKYMEPIVDDTPKEQANAENEQEPGETTGDATPGTPTEPS
jgi:N-acetyl-anhydromuramyl-L-alanine amidase AmpD